MVDVANPWVPTPMPLAGVTRELPDAFTWILQPPAPFRWRPGQFNMIYVPGIGEAASAISGGPLVHTIRVVGAVTRALEKLVPGDLAFVRGPYGTSWPLEQASGRDLLLIAGGLGLASLRPAIRAALTRRERYGHVAILCAARSPEEILFPAELAGWRARFDVAVQIIVDRAGRDWPGPVGAITDLLGSSVSGARTIGFVSGPEAMMRFVLRALEALGVPPTHVWVSLERSMKCGLGLCGHCQLGGHFVCKDGPIYRADRVAPLLAMREL